MYHGAVLHLSSGGGGSSLKVIAWFLFYSIIYSVQVFIPALDSDWSVLDGQWLVHNICAKLY